jgi:hypothetical protein
VAKAKPKSIGAAEESAEYTDGRKWEHEEGDVLEGTILEVSEFDGGYGDTIAFVIEPVVGLTTEAGGDDSAVSADDPLKWYATRSNNNDGKPNAAYRSLPKVVKSAIESDEMTSLIGGTLRVEFVGEQNNPKSGRTFKKFNVNYASA